MDCIQKLEISDKFFSALYRNICPRFIASNDFNRIGYTALIKIDVFFGLALAQTVQVVASELGFVLKSGSCFQGQSWFFRIPYQTTAGAEAFCIYVTVTEDKTATVIFAES